MRDANRFLPGWEGCVDIMAAWEKTAEGSARAAQEKKDAEDKAKIESLSKSLKGTTK